jgi:hypothetical protein
MSPVEICGIFFSAINFWACVPFPEPGAPNNTIRIEQLSLTGNLWDA